jgi:hypothetical protein
MDPEAVYQAKRVQAMKARRKKAQNFPDSDMFMIRRFSKTLARQSVFDWNESERAGV